MDTQIIDNAAENTAGEQEVVENVSHETTVAEEPQVEAQSEAGELPSLEPLKPIQDAGKPSQPVTAEEYLWEKDKRYGSLWKKDPNNLFRSYRELEGAYGKTKELVNKYSKILGEYKIDAPEKIADILKEYQEFKNPDNPMVANHKYLSEIMADPVDAEKMKALLQDIERNRLMRQYPGMDEATRTRIIETETKLRELQAEREAEKQQRLMKESTETLNQSIREVEEIAKEKGFQVTDAGKYKLLKYCEENGITPDLLPYAFMKLYKNELNKAQTQKVETDTIKKINQNKQNTVISSKGQKSTASEKKMSFGEQLRGALFKAREA